MLIIFLIMRLRDLMTTSDTVSFKNGSEYIWQSAKNEENYIG